MKAKTQVKTRGKAEVKKQGAVTIRAHKGPISEARQNLRDAAAVAEQAPAVTEAYKTNAAAHGISDGRVSREWASRPDDQRYTSLKSLHTALVKRTEKMAEAVIETRKIEVSGPSVDQLVIQAGDVKVEPTHFGLGALCYYIGAPASYLRGLPGDLAARCLQHGLTQSDMFADGAAKLYHGGGKLWGLTSPKFGRIYDRDVVEAVMKVAGDGSRWKVPGMLQGGKYNPFVDVTKETTTLYASDHDVFLFLVDDLHPISVGKLANGDDDLMFRGFYVWNSEVGGKSFGISTFLLRGVCQNRNLWGVEDQITMTIRHTKTAPGRFVEDMNKTLLAYSEASAKPIIAKVAAAKKQKVAINDEERVVFYQKIGLSKAQAMAAIKRCVDEEGRQPETPWDFTQGLTALARTSGMTDERVRLEKIAAGIMEKVKA